MSCFLCWNNSRLVVEVWAIYVVWWSVNIHFHLSLRFMSSVTWCCIVGWVVLELLTMKVEALEFFRLSVGNCYCAVLRNIQKTWIPNNSTVTVSNVVSVELLHFLFSKGDMWVRVILRISPSGYAFNNKFCILPTQCVCLFYVDLRTNSCCFPVQHWLAGFYNRDVECLLRGTDWVCEYKLVYLCL
jgi:hypothetical protein